MRRCSVCGKDLKPLTADEEAEARRELAQNFDVPVEQCDVVCNDCYQKIMGWLETQKEEIV